MTARSVLFVKLIVVSLVLIVSCEPSAMSSKELEIEIPKGNEIALDGTLSPEEWNLAYKAELAGDGELLLMHNDGYLYLGVRGKPEPVTSVCVFRDSEVVVMHSSAALGTAIYQRGEEEWKRVREFSWSCRDTSNTERAMTERAEHLEKEGWVGSNGRMGVAEEVEMQIKMSDSKLLLSVASIGAPDYEEVSWWPARLEDGCLDLDLIRGSTPELMGFLIEQWVIVSASP